MKRWIAACLVFVITLLQSAVCFGREVSTYDVLMNMDSGFIERFLDAGLPEEMVRSFIDVLDEEADKLQKPEDRETLENYFLSLLLIYIFQQEKYMPVLVAFDQAFREEVDYIAETGRVPKSMEVFFLSVMGNSFAAVVPEEDGFEDAEIEPEHTEVIQPPVQPTPPSPPPFCDMEGYEWAIPSVQYLKYYGYINGYEDGTFRPGAAITRGELCYLVAKSFLDANYRNESSQYPDAQPGSWYYDALLTAEYFSLFQWIYEGEFQADDYVTRQEMCAVIYRAYRRSASDLARLKPCYDFLDFAQIANYAYDPIQRLQQAGCISGYENGEFLPLKLATRAEAAKVIAMIMWLPQ